MKNPFSLTSVNNNHKIVLYVSFILFFSVLAQHRSFAQNITLTNSGKVVYKEGDKETVISTDPNDIVLMTPYNDLVYYIERKSVTTDNAQHFDTRIMSFNLKSGKRKEVVGQGDKADFGYKISNEIAAICLDKITNRIYFSTAVPTGKITEYLTWYYDLSSGDLKSFKDGKAQSVDEFGNIKVLINGLDYQGTYTQTAVFASNGKMVSMTNKEY